MMTAIPAALTEHQFRPSESAEPLEALLLRPVDARWLLVLAHGAGAGMRHPFMNSLARELAARGIATFRYQFPYMQQQRKRPDTTEVLIATVRAAVVAAAETASDLPLLAGGKSLGGRMTSLALSEESSARKTDAPMRVRGLLFLGFPLHPPGSPGTQRADHLERVKVPMLFLQGTRDALAELDLVRAVCEKLGPRAMLHVFDTADHSFHVLKRSGTTDVDVLRELALTVASWADSLA